MATPVLDCFPSSPPEAAAAAVGGVPNAAARRPPGTWAQPPEESEESEESDDASTDPESWYDVDAGVDWSDVGWWGTASTEWDSQWASHGWSEDSYGATPGWSDISEVNLASRPRPPGKKDPKWSDKARLAEVLRRYVLKEGGQVARKPLGKFLSKHTKAQGVKVNAVLAAFSDVFKIVSTGGKKKGEYVVLSKTVKVTTLSPEARAAKDAQAARSWERKEYLAQYARHFIQQHGGQMPATMLPRVWKTPEGIAALAESGRPPLKVEHLIGNWPHIFKYKKNGPQGKPLIFLEGSGPSQAKTAPVSAALAAAAPKRQTNKKSSSGEKAAARKAKKEILAEHMRLYILQHGGTLSKKQLGQFWNSSEGKTATALAGRGAVKASTLASIFPHLLRMSSGGPGRMHMVTAFQRHPQGAKAEAPAPTPRKARESVPITHTSASAAASASTPVFDTKADNLVFRQLASELRQFVFRCGGEIEVACVGTLYDAKPAVKRLHEHAGKPKASEICRAAREWLQYDCDESGNAWIIALGENPQAGMGATQQDFGEPLAEPAWEPENERGDRRVAAHPEAAHSILRVLADELRRYIFWHGGDMDADLAMEAFDQNVDILCLYESAGRPKVSDLCRVARDWLRYDCDASGIGWIVALGPRPEAPRLVEHIQRVEAEHSDASVPEPEGESMKQDDSDGEDEDEDDDDDDGVEYEDSESGSEELDSHEQDDGEDYEDDKDGDDDDDDDDGEVDENDDVEIGPGLWKETRAPQKSSSSSSTSTSAAAAAAAAASSSCAAASSSASSLAKPAPAKLSAILEEGDAWVHKDPWGGSLHDVLAAKAAATVKATGPQDPPESAQPKEFNTSRLGEVEWARDAWSTSQGPGTWASDGWSAAGGDSCWSSKSWSESGPNLKDSRDKLDWRSSAQVSQGQARSELSVAVGYAMRLSDADLAEATDLLWKEVRRRSGQL